MPHLESAFLKLSRGQDGIEQLLREISAALDPQAHPVGTTISQVGVKKPTSSRDPRPWRGFVLSLRDDVPVLDAPIGLLLGEVIQNLRSSLDHLAWAIVPSDTRRALTAGQRRQIQFPMARSRRAMAAELGRRIPGTSPDLHQLINSYQPYRRTRRGRIIRRLQQLSNADKHRLIIPAVALPIHGEIEAIARGGEFVRRVDHRRRGQPISPGAKLHTYVVAGAEPELTVSSRITIRAVLPRSVVKPARGDVATSLPSALRGIGGVCEEILTRVSDQASQ